MEPYNYGESDCDMMTPFEYMCHQEMTKGNGRVGNVEWDMYETHPSESKSWIYSPFTSTPIDRYQPIAGSLETYMGNHALNAYETV